MDYTEQMKIDVISKLMNESQENSDPAKKSLDELFQLISEELPEILDNGMYEANALVVRSVMDSVRSYEAMTVIPELFEKNLFLFPESDRQFWSEFSDFDMEGIKKLKSELSVPLLILPCSQEKEEIYALTYMNKLIPLSEEEFQICAEKLHWHDIEIRKLVQAFVIKKKSKYDKSVFLGAPSAELLQDSFWSFVPKMTREVIFTAKKSEVWKKKLSEENPYGGRMLFFQRDGRKKQEGTVEYVSPDSEELSRLLSEDNNFYFKHCLQEEIEYELTRVLHYYAKMEQKLSDKIARLSKDSLNSSDEGVKKTVKEYRQELVEQRESGKACQWQLERLLSRIVELTKKMEAHLSTSYKDTTPSYFYDRYVEEKLKLFFARIYAGKFSDAEADVAQLQKVGVPFCSTLNLFEQYHRQDQLPRKALVDLLELPEEHWAMVKIKLELLDLSTVPESVLMGWATSLPDLETGKEHFYYAKAMLQKELPGEAKKHFFYALEQDYTDAGRALFEMADRYPQCNIGLEELAEYLVPEANYQLGLENMSEHPKKGKVYLKIAAIGNNFDAVRNLVREESERLLKMPIPELKMNRKRVQVVTDLCQNLYEKDPSEEYMLIVGKLFDKLGYHSKAFKCYSKLSSDEAKYELAKCYEYGYGTKKDIDKALEYFRKLPENYKDVLSHLSYLSSKNPVIESLYTVGKLYGDILGGIAMRASRKEEDDDEDYEPTVHTTTESDSSCFITTAACLALNLGDDCEALNALRRFRDEHISGDHADGDLLVKEYYRIGPTLVQHIEAERDPSAIYRGLWENYILPSYHYIETKEWHEAKMIFM